MELYKRLLKLARPHWLRFIFAMVCMAVVGATTGAAAFLVKPAMDDIFLNRDAVALKWIPVAVVIIYLLKGLGNYGQTIIMSYIGPEGSHGPQEPALQSHLKAAALVLH